MTWPLGGDPAISIIPNFLLTGIVTMALGVAAGVWSVFFMRRARGPRVFLLLFMAQTLTGGGIGYIPYYIIVWLYARRLNGPLNQWRKLLPVSWFSWRGWLARIWLPAIVLAIICWLAGLAASVFGVFPGVSDFGTLMNVIMLLLLGTLILMNVAFAGAAAADIAAR